MLLKQYVIHFGPFLFHHGNKFGKVRALQAIGPHHIPRAEKLLIFLYLDLPSSAAQFCDWLMEGKKGVMSCCANAPAADANRQLRLTLSERWWSMLERMRWNTYGPKTYSWPSSLLAGQRPDKRLPCITLDVTFRARMLSRWWSQETPGSGLTEV